MAVPSKLRRRAVSWSVLHLALVVMWALAIPVLSGLVIVDLVRRRPRLHLTRVYALGLGLVTVEFVMFWAGVLTSVLTVHGRAVSADRWSRINVRLQDRWIGWQAAVGRVTCRFRIEVENPEVAEEADAIVMGRHLSHADALFPAMVYGSMAGHELRYMLKEELQWPPAMDLVGNRLPHVWIDRAPGPDSPMLAVMRARAADIDSSTVACIFPEGTFFTPGRSGRAVERLGRTRPDLVEVAATLRHVLPPRPAGALALLEGAPDADVVVLGHIGLERFSSIRDIIGAVPLAEPVRIHLWRHRRRELPEEPFDQAEWLVRRWAELDEWVDQRLRASRTRPAVDDVAV